MAIKDVIGRTGYDDQDWSAPFSQGKIRLLSCNCIAVTQAKEPTGRVTHWGNHLYQAKQVLERIGLLGGNRRSMLLGRRMSDRMDGRNGTLFAYATRLFDFTE